MLAVCQLCVVSVADREPSLGIKYRPKKMKEEKESETEREEKTDGDGSSTPQPKIDRRRGSQVTQQLGVSFIQSVVTLI